MDLQLINVVMKDVKSHTTTMQVLLFENRYSGKCYTVHHNGGRIKLTTNFKESKIHTIWYNIRGLSNSP